MYLKKCIDEIKTDKIKIFVDMDGVIADYIVGEARGYDKKRPLHTTIKQLEGVSHMNKEQNDDIIIFKDTVFID